MTLEMVLIIGLIVIAVAALVALPVSLHVVLRFYRDTASVNGTPLVLAEKTKAGEFEAHALSEKHRHELKKAENEAKLAYLEDKLAGLRN